MTETVLPVWDERASDYVASSLNKIFEQLNLPYEADLEGEERCYDTPRYGLVCHNDGAKVYIVDKSGNKVPATLTVNRTCGQKHYPGHKPTVAGFCRGEATLKIQGNPPVVIKMVFLEEMEDHMHAISLKLKAFKIG